MIVTLKMLLLCMLFYFLYHCNLVIHLIIHQILSHMRDILINLISSQSFVLIPPKYILSILYTIDIMVQYKSENK